MPKINYYGQNERGLSATMKAADRIAELEDELKQRDRRIDELKRELDDARDLIRRLEEHVEDRSGIIDGWVEAFEMVLEGDEWSWGPFIDRHNETVGKYAALVRKWNKFVPEYNAAVLKRNVGRPLAASEAQQADVLRRRKRGESLQYIADETNLTMRTVRTVIEKANGTDRTTGKHLERVAPENMAAWKARKRTRDALPRRVNALLNDKRELLKEAKGLK